VSERHDRTHASIAVRYADNPPTTTNKCIRSSFAHRQLPPATDPSLCIAGQRNRCAFCPARAAFARRDAWPTYTYSVYPPPSRMNVT